MTVRSVWLDVIGKSRKGGKKLFKLNLHKDDDFPKFCPIRHLFTYLKIIKYKGGWVFPSSGEINGSVPSIEGVYNTRITYSMLQKILENIVYKALKITNQKITTHFIRKTGEYKC